MSWLLKQMQFDKTIPKNKPILGLPKEIKYDLNNVDRVDEISYECFFTDYLTTNKPCIITHSATETWKSRHDWVTSDGLPNFDSLMKEFGTSVVPVADCDTREYNSQHKIEMPFKDYLNYWQKLISMQEKSSQNLYLKDWHFQRQGVSII